MGSPFLHTLTPAEFPPGTQLNHLPVAPKAQGWLLAPWLVRVTQPKSWVLWQPDCNLSLTLRDWGQNRNFFFSYLEDNFPLVSIHRHLNPSIGNFLSCFVRFFCKCDNLYDFNNNLIWFFLISLIRLMIKSIKFLLNHLERQIACSPHGTDSTHTHTWLAMSTFQQNSNVWDVACHRRIPKCLEETEQQDRMMPTLR